MRTIVADEANLDRYRLVTLLPTPESLNWLQAIIEKNVATFVLVLIISVVLVYLLYY